MATRFSIIEQMIGSIQPFHPRRLSLIFSLRPEQFIRPPSKKFFPFHILIPNSSIHFHSNLLKKKIHFNTPTQYTFYRLSTSFPLYLLYKKIVSSSLKPKSAHCYETLFNVRVNKTEFPLLLNVR